MRNVTLGVGSGLHFIRSRTPSPPYSPKIFEELPLGEEPAWADHERKDDIQGNSNKRKYQEIEEEAGQGKENEGVVAEVMTHHQEGAIAFPPLSDNQLNFLLELGLRTLSARETKMKRTSSRQLRQKQLHQQQLQQLDQRRRGIWTLDTHISLRARIRKCLVTFDEVVSYPVHPAVIEEANMNWLLDSGEPSLYPSPLALSMFTAICIGAQSLKEPEIEEEFYRRAREQAGELMDETDYHVATGLMMLGTYCCNHVHMKEQVIYYATLGASICEQLGAFNNSTYPRLLVQAHLSPAGGRQRESMITYYSKVLRIKEARRTLTSLPIPRKIATTAITQGNDDPYDQSGTLSTTTTNARELEEGLDCVMQEVLVDINILLLQALVSPDERQRVGEYLDWVNDKWERVKHAYKKAQALSVEILLASVCTRFACMLQNSEGARRHAIRFVELAEDPLFQYVQFTVLEFLAYPVLLYFTEVGDLPMLQTIVTILAPMNEGRLFEGSLKTFWEQAKMPTLMPPTSSSL